MSIWASTSRAENLIFCAVLELSIPNECGDTTRIVVGSGPRKLVNLYGECVLPAIRPPAWSMAPSRRQSAETK